MPTEKFSIEQLGQKAKAKGKYADFDDTKAGLTLLEEAPQYWAHIADEYKPDPDKQLSLEEFGKRVREKMPDRFTDKDDITAATEMLAENPIYWKSVVEKKKNMAGQGSGDHWSNSTPSPLIKRLPNNPIAKVEDLAPMPNATQDKKPKKSGTPIVPFTGGADASVYGTYTPTELKRMQKEKEEAYFQSDEFKEHVAKVQGIAEPVIKKYQQNLDKGLLPSGRPMDYEEPVRKNYLGLTINNLTPEKRKELKSKEYTYQFVDMVMNLDPDLKNLSDEERYEVRTYLNSRVAGNEKEKEREKMINQVIKSSGVDPSEVVKTLNQKIQDYDKKIGDLKLLANDAASQMQKELAAEERQISEGLKLLSSQLQEAVSAGQVTPEDAQTQFELAYTEQLANLNRRAREQSDHLAQSFNRLYEERYKDLNAEISKLKVNANKAGIEFDPETGKIAYTQDFYDRVMTRVQALEGSAHNAKNMRQWANYSFAERSRLILSSGVGDMIHTVAGTYLANGMYQTGESLRQMAEKMQFDQIPDVGEFSAKSFLDPMWWETKGLRMLPFTLTLMGPGMGVGALGRGAALALNASKAVAGVSGAAAAAISSRYLESLMEGGGSYLEVLNNGGSVAEAEKQFSYVAANNAALATSDFLQFLPMFGSAVKGWARATAVLGGSVLEGGEEIYQEWVAKRASDRDYGLLEFADSPAGREVFALGAVNGLAFEMIGTGANNVSDAAKNLRIKAQTEKLMRQQIGTMLVAGEGLVQRKAQLANTLEVQMLNGIINKEDYEAAIQTLDEVVKNFQVVPSTLDDSGRSQFLEAMHDLKIINGNLSNATPETEEIFKKQKSEKLSQIDKILKGNAEGYFVDNVSYTKDEFTQLINNPQFVALANQPGHLVEVRNDEEMLNLVNQRVYGQKLEEQTDPDAKPVEKSTAPTATYTPETSALLEKIQQGKALTLEEGMSVFTELTAEQKRLKEIKGTAQNQTSGEIATEMQAIENQIGVVGAMLNQMGMTQEQIGELFPKEEVKTDKKKEKAEPKKELTDKEKQLEIILKNNPMTDDVHTGIRKVEDIQTFDETLAGEEDDLAFTPDYTIEDAKDAQKSGKITVYSSKPITKGSFVTPSKMEAKSYAGQGNKIYSQVVNTKDIAWIDTLQGQYAELPVLKKKVKKAEPVVEKVAKVKEKKAKVKEVEATPEVTPEVVAEAKEELRQAEEEHDAMLEEEEVPPVVDPEKPAPKVETRAQFINAAKKAFGLNDMAAKVFGVVTDMAATAYARRNKTTKQAYYDKIKIEKKKAYDSKETAKVLFQIRPPSDDKYDEVTPTREDTKAVRAEMKRLLAEAKALPDAIIPEFRLDPATGLPKHRVWVHKKTGERLVKIDSKEIPYDHENLAKKHLNPDRQKAINILVNRIYNNLFKPGPDGTILAEHEDVKGAMGWYSKTAKWIQRHIGGNAELFAQLLGATSPATPVKENWKSSWEALRNYSAGMYDDLLKRYDKHVKKHEALTEEELVEIWNKTESAKLPSKFQTDGTPRPSYQAKLEQLRIKLINKFDEVPLKANGKRFNANSEYVLKALYGNYLAHIQSSKIQDYAGNLTGRLDNAVIDVWAARYLRRAIFQGSGIKRWRIQPMEELGVDVSKNAKGEVIGDYAFAQDVFHAVAKKANMTYADLQALLWYLEKKNLKDAGIRTTQKEGDSFEKYWAEERVMRYQAGFTTDGNQNNDPYSQETQDEAKKKIKAAIRALPGLISMRVTDTVGNFGGEENALDIEFTVEEGTDISSIRELMKQLRVEYKQTATFVSEIVELDHPKARPLLEVLFSKMLSGKEKGVKGDDIVEKISGIFGANKLGYAFTTNTKGEITGVRSQYIPDYRAEGLTEEEGEDIFNDAVDKVLEALEEAGIIAQANVWGVLTESYQENEQTDAETLEQPKDTEVHEGTRERKEDSQSGDTDTNQSDRPVDGKPKGVDSGTGNTKIDRQFKDSIVGLLSPFLTANEESGRNSPTIVEFVARVIPEKYIARYQRLYELASRMGITINVGRGVVSVGNKATWGGGSVNLDPFVTLITEDNWDTFIESLNHEIIHGILHFGISAMDSFKFHSELVEVWKTVQANFDKASDTVKDIITYISDTNREFRVYDYGDENYNYDDRSNNPSVGSLEELITYAFTDVEFAKFLSSIKSPYDRYIESDKMTIFDSLKAIIKRFFEAVGGRTLLDDIHSTLNKYLDYEFQAKNWSERNAKYWGKATKVSELKNIRQAQIEEARRISEKELYAVNGIAHIYHYSGQDLTDVDPAKFGRNAITSDKRKFGVSFFYNSPFKEAVVDGKPYVVTVNANKVYPINSDPLQIVPIVEAQLEAQGIPVTTNNILDFSREVLLDLGYEGQYSTSFSARMEDGKTHNNMVRIEMFIKQPVDNAATQMLRKYGTPNPRKEEVYERNKIEIRNAWYALQNNGLREQLEAHAKRLFGKGFYSLTLEEATRADYVATLMNEMAPYMNRWKNIIQGSLDEIAQIDRGEVTLFQKQQDTMFDDVQQAKEEGVPLASIRFVDGKSIITGYEGANVASLFHELGGHFTFEEILNGLDSTDPEIKARSVKELNIIVDAYNKNNPNNPVQASHVFTNKDVYVAVHEFFANGFVQAVLKFGETEPALMEVFKKFAKWIKNLFEGLKGEGIILTPELETLYREVLNLSVEETQSAEPLTDDQVEQVLDESQTPIKYRHSIIKMLNTTAGVKLRQYAEVLANLYHKVFTPSTSSEKEIAKIVNQMRYVIDLQKGNSLTSPIIEALFSQDSNPQVYQLLSDLISQFESSGKLKGEAFDRRNPDHFEMFDEFILGAMLSINPNPMKTGESFMNGGPVPTDIYGLFEDYRIFASGAASMAVEAGISIPDTKMNMLKHMGVSISKPEKNGRKGLIPGAIKDEFGRIAVSISGNSLGIKEGEEVFYYEDGEVYPMSDPLGYLDKATEMEKTINAERKYYVRIYSVDPTFATQIPRMAAGLINRMGLEFQVINGEKGIYLDIRGEKDLVNRAMAVINQAFVDKITTFYKGDKKGLVNLFNMVVQDAGFKAIAYESGNLKMFEQPNSSLTIKGQTLFQRKSPLTDKQVREASEALTKEMEAIKKRLREQRVNSKALNATGNAVFERQFTIKRLLWASGNNKGAAKAVDALNRVRRANAITSHQLQQAFERVLGSIYNSETQRKGKSILNSKEKKLLSRVVNMRRVIELDKIYDATGRARLTHTTIGLNNDVMTIGKEFAEGWLTLLNNKDAAILADYGVKPNRVKRIMEAADEFSNIMSEQLEQLRKHEVISENAYQKLKQEGQHYSPRLFVAHLEETIQTGRAAMSKSGIHNLDEGDSGLMLEDVQQFLAMRIRDTQQAIANARLGRAFHEFLQTTVVPWGYIPKYSHDFIERLINHQKAIQENQAANLSLDNLNTRGTVKPIETKYIEPSWETPMEGFRQITFVLPGGSRMAIHLTNDVADQYEGYRFDMPDWISKATDILSVLTMTKVLKATATGYNPEFLVRNIPLDILHIQLNTDVYGRSALLGTAKMMWDIIVPKKGRRAILDQVLTRQGVVRDYYRTGGYNQSLTHEGQWDIESNKWNKSQQWLNVITDFLGYLGQSSELMTRLALRQKYMDTKLAEYTKAGIILSAEEREELEYEGTEYALGYLDFSQGGAVTKELDKFIPYLNAATQVTYGSLKTLKSNPAMFIQKVTELGVFTVMLGAWNLGLYGDLVKWMHPGEDDDERKKRLADRAKFYMEHINPRIKANNWIVMTNMTYMTETGKRYLYFKIPKDASITALVGWFEGAFLASHTGDTSHLLNKQRVAEMKTISTLLGDMSFTPPILKAFHNYNTNQDSYFDDKIWKGKDVQPWAEYQVGRTPNMYVELGELFATKNDKGELEGGLSPMRLNNAVNQIIAKNNTFYAMFEKVMNVTIGDNVMPPKTQDQAYEAMTKQFFIRRVLASTDYTLDREVIENFELNANTMVQMVDNEIAVFQQKLDDGELNETDIPDFVEYVAGKLMPDELPDYQRKINKAQFERVKRKAIRRALNNEGRSKHDYKLYMAMYYDDTPRADYLYHLLRNADTKEDRQYFFETAKQIDGFINQPVKDRLQYLEGRFGTKFTSE